MLHYALDPINKDMAKFKNKVRPNLKARVNPQGFPGAQQGNDNILQPRPGQAVMRLCRLAERIRLHK